MKSIFDFKDYKAFLLATEESRKQYERGFRSRLARKLDCQSGYITHVLGGQAHLSLEQAMLASEFLKLKEPEKKYLLLLVSLARAGTPALRTHFESELRKLKEEHLNIKERVAGAKNLSEAEQTVYYSSWHYIAVHVLTSFGQFNDAATIADALKIPQEVVGKVLIFLLQAGLLTNKNGVLKPGVTQVHLNRESPLIRQHHTNWRIAAIQSLVNDRQTDLHYSTVSTLSKTDAENLRAEMVKLIEHYVATIKPSKDEVMYGFNLDFFNMLKG